VNLDAVVQNKRVSDLVPVFLSLLPTNNKKKKGKRKEK